MRHGVQNVKCCVDKRIDILDVHGFFLMLLANKGYAGC
jgi:hypothetical protein